MTALEENLERLEEAIGRACRAAGRARGEVELMAVSKTYPAETIAEAAGLGLRLFGENRVQEFATKALQAAELERFQDRYTRLCFVPGRPFLGSGRLECNASESSNPETAVRSVCGAADLRVHLIGHLQSNKAARAAEIFDAVDTVDSLKLAERLNEAAGKLRKRLPVLIEVKLSPEATKAGLEPGSDEAARLLERLPELEQLEMQGLMTIAPWGVAEDVTRACFRSLGEWREEWARHYPRLRFDVLSMGMSGDFGPAIAEGATRIRIGTALFGKRQPWTGPAE